MSSILSQLTPLEKRVIRQLGGGKDGIESAADAARHGADAGFGGFTYYSDTIKFFKRNKAAILALLKELGESLGESPSNMLKNFKYLKDIDDPMLALHDPRSDDYDTVANSLAWFALEETGQHVLQLKGE